MHQNSPSASSASRSEYPASEMDYETNQLLPREIIEEEKKSILEREKEMLQRDSSTNEPTETPAEKRQRYKNLMTLLDKSNRYAVFMGQKLITDKVNGTEESKENTLQEAPKEKPATGKRKRTSGSSSVVPPKKLKVNENQNVESSSLYYTNKAGLVVSRRQPTLLVGGTMRDYQLDGLDWLITLYKNAVNGILADEMGLGKTIQVIALLCHLREKGIFGPHLIVAPLSTLPNWLLEFANFAPDLPVMMFHGTDKQRTVMKLELRKTLKNDKSKMPIIVTSYEMPIRDTKFFTSVSWSYTIVDEGHRLKNYNSVLGRQMRLYKAESRLLLTGTPLQNNLTELWSLLNYLIPEIFNNLTLFENLFNFSDLSDSEKMNQLIEKEKEEQLVSKMHQILEPFLLRRLKADVNIELPRKKEVLVYAPLSTVQEELYKAVLDDSILDRKGFDIDAPIDDIKSRSKRKSTRVIKYSEDWDDDDDFEIISSEEGTPKPSEPVLIRVKVEEDGHYIYNVKMQNKAMILRKIANHPYLVKTPIFPGTRDMLLDDRMISRTGKLLVLDALLPKLKTDQHKVLLFSTFVAMLDLIEEYVMMRGYKFVRLDGNYQLEDRLQAIKQFNSDSDTFIFLISTRAGGLGINLTAADTVIIYDSDWNPQVDLQAQDRCHRIGQTRPVVVYRLVTKGTIDERIVNIAAGKRRLEKLVVKKGQFRFGGNAEMFSIAELQQLLESTDHSKEIHPNGLVLSDEQIEELLDRSDLVGEKEEKVDAKLLKVDRKQLSGVNL